MHKTWFITGAGRGLGRAFTEAALERGDSVAATVRRTDALADLAIAHGDRLAVFTADITDRDAVFAAVDGAVEAFGGLDVVVNNAGYGLFGAVEDITEQQLRDQMEVNLFGVFHVVQAVLPVLRRQGVTGHGHIIQISTVGGVAAFPNLGGYHASKWALEGLSESLSQELDGTGIRVTLVEPGGFDTDWDGSSSVRAAGMDAPTTEGEAGARPHGGTSPYGDPEAAGQAILTLADAENPPLRVLFGTFPVQYIPNLYQQRLNEWQRWEPLAISAHG